MQEPNLNLIERLAIDQELDDEINQQNTSTKAAKARERYHSDDRVLKGTTLFSRLFFLWISPLLSYGNHCSIDTNDLPKLHDSMNPMIEFTNLYNKMGGAARSQRKGWTLLKSIAGAYCSSLSVLAGLSLVITIFTMTAPILTHSIISYVKNPPQERSAEEGVILIVGIASITLGKAVLQSHLYYKFAILGFNLATTLSLLLYEKSLKYPSLCEKKYSIPEIINYSQVDAQRMTNMGVQLTSVLYTPIQIVIGVWLMYSYIGVSFVFGMGTMIVMIAVTFLLAKKISKVNEQTLKRKDQRMKKTEELLQIIRFIKINALEKYFYKKVDQKRSSELQSNRKRGVLEVFVVFLYFISCPLIIFLTFLAYIQFGHVIDATTAFSTIMIFNILQGPLRQFPSALSSLIQMYTSLVRIEQFLMAKQIDRGHITTNEEEEEEKVAIKIQNGTFRWGVEESHNQKAVSKEVIQYRKTHPNQQQKEEQDVDNLHLNQSCNSTRQYKNSIERITKGSDSLLDQTSEDSSPTLPKSNVITAIKRVNLTIEKGKFIMVLGDIGSGKSSFLLAILNEMNNSKNSSITVNGSIAYAAQKPWIMHGTVRDNITFCKAFERRKFDTTLSFASLKTDLKMLVRGQFTQIGQKGANLSGGQKARISFARAVYSERDILLLDDIISAVDVHVAEFLIKETILGYLKGKTIVLATHAANFAQYADEVIILKKGVMVRKGPFNAIRDTEEFRQIYEAELKKQKSSESAEDKKISNDQKKEKETMNLILQIKKSRRSDAAPDKLVKSFTQKAVQQLMIPQDHKKGSIGLQVIKDYIKLNGGSIFVLIVSISMLGWLSFSLLSNIYIQLWCKDEHHDNYYLYVYIVLSVCGSLGAFVRAYTLVLSGFKQGEKVHKKIIQSLLYASLNEFYLRVPVGRIMNRLTKDLRELDQTIGYAVGNFLTYLFSLIGTLSICIYGSTPFMIIPTVIVIYLCNLLRQYYMKTQREILRVQAKTNSPIVSGFISTINGLPTIRAYKLEEEFMDMQVHKVGVNKGARITREALESWFAFRLTLLSFAISIVSIIFAIVNTSIDSALVGLLLSYAFNLNDDIISLTFSWANLETRMISVERIHHFMKIEPEKSYGQYCEKWSEVEEGYQSIIEKGEIQFRDVSVRYRADLPYALKNVSFKIRAGEKVGIVGRTGAGKSTIYACLLRLVDPCSGTILFDDTECQTFFLKDLRNAITMIDQEPTLLKGTFRENLDIKGIYSDAQLYKILEECNLYDMVMERDGLDNKIDNSNLSAGEKQLLCICRAFMKKSKIVIIDEATANIDMKNDERIQKVIKEQFKNSTVLTIAHRLSTLKTSDKIIVMGEGRVLEFGSPKELEERGGLYAEMVEKNLSQFFV